MDSYTAAELAGQAIESAVHEVELNDNTVQHSKSSSRSYVTATDEAVDELIREQLSEQTEYSVESEESNQTADTDTYWIVDPIDGTIPFAHGVSTYASMAALVRDGRPVASAVYIPPTGEMFTADTETVYKNGVEISGMDMPDEAVFCNVIPGRGYDDNRYRDFHDAVVDEALSFGVYSAGYSSAILSQNGASMAAYARLAKWDYMPTVRLIESSGGVVGSLETGNTGIDAIKAVDGRLSCFATSEDTFAHYVDVYNTVTDN